MKRISLENAKPGQILAKKLERQDGVLLAGQGAEVTEGLLRMLARMNIDSILIEEENQLSAEEIEEIFLQKTADYQARFRRVEEQPVLMALKSALWQLALQEKEEALAAIIPEASAPAEAVPASL